MGMLDIDKLTPENIEQINALSKELSENAPIISKNDLLRVLKNGIIATISTQKGEIIGMATLIIYQTLMGRIGRVEDVVVHKAHRGKGLGEQLVEALIARARSYGLKHIDLTSSPKRVAANALYQKLGFVKRKTNAYRRVL